MVYLLLSFSRGMRRQSHSGKKLHNLSLQPTCAYYAGFSAEFVKRQKMPLSLDQFRESLRTESEDELRQRFENSRGKEKYAEHALVVKRELDARFPGWEKPRTRRGGSRATIARFRGKEREFDTARSAYIWLVERFASVNPTLFTDVRWETTGYVGIGRRRGPDGAARNYFAKAPAKLFRQTPTLAGDPNNFHLLKNGWFVNLNLNTRENFEILCRFASVSKLKHGDDWDWEVLEPTGQLNDVRQRALLAEELQKEIDEFFRHPPETDA